MNIEVFLGGIRQMYDSFFCAKKGIIRVGERTAWYILDKVPKNAVILSGGLGTETTFEEALCTGKNVVYGFDPTPPALNHLKKRKMPKQFKFIKEGLAGESKDVPFFEPDDKDTSYLYSFDGKGPSFHCTSVSDFCKKHKIKHIDVFKIDIEGFEYEVFEDMLKHGILPDQICVEYHHFMKGFTRVQTLRSVKKLYKAGYRFIYKEQANYAFAHKRILRKK